MRRWPGTRRSSPSMPPMSTPFRTCRVLGSNHPPGRRAHRPPSRVPPRSKERTEMTTLDAAPVVAPETESPDSSVKVDEVSEISDKEKNKRRRKIALLVILLLIFALLFGWYLFNRKPLSELPGLSQAKVPHYEFSIYGTNHPLGVAATASGDRIYVTQSDGARV